MPKPEPDGETVPPAPGSPGGAGTILVVWHSRSGHTAQLVEALLEGIALAELGLEEGESSEVRSLDCFEAGAEDVQRAAALVLATPANFGYMSGAMKDFFERIYYPCLESTPALPYLLMVKGDTDTGGAVASVERIVTGLGWRRVLPVLAVTGTLEALHLERAREMGATLAAGLSQGIF